MPDLILVKEILVKESDATISPSSQQGGNNGLLILNSQQRTTMDNKKHHIEISVQGCRGIRGQLWAPYSFATSFFGGTFQLDYGEPGELGLC